VVVVGVALGITSRYAMTPELHHYESFPIGNGKEAAPTMLPHWPKHVIKVSQFDRQRRNPFAEVEQYALLQKEGERCNCDGWLTARV